MKVVDHVLYEKIPITNSAEHDGITYERGTVVMTKYDGHCEFGLIEDVTNLNGCLYLILKDTSIIEFEQHLHSYILEIKDIFLIKNVSNLASPYALPAYRTESNDLVVRLKHILPPCQNI